jgi:hypothetical protein
MMSNLQLKPRELKIISVIAATHSIGDAAAVGNGAGQRE